MPSQLFPACSGLEIPPFFDEHPGAAVPDSEGKLLPVCLVDHNEDKQMVPSLRDAPDRKKRIIGLIDHHVTRKQPFSNACDELYVGQTWSGT